MLSDSTPGHAYPVQPISDSAITLTATYCYRQAAYSLDRGEIKTAGEWRLLGDSIAIHGG